MENNLKNTIPCKAILEYFSTSLLMEELIKRCDSSIDEFVIKYSLAKICGGKSAFKDSETITVDYILKQLKENEM